MRSKRLVRNGLTIASIAVALVAITLLDLGLVGVAHGSVRTGQASPPSSNMGKPSDAFPGLGRVSVLYDEGNRKAQVNITFRTPLINPNVSSALRSTSLLLVVGSSVGGTAPANQFDGGCSVGPQGMSLDISLATLQTEVPIFGESKPVASISLDSTRTQMSVEFDVSQESAKPNPVCIRAILSGGREYDFAEAMLDGFDWMDGDLESIPETDLWQTLNRLALHLTRRGAGFPTADADVLSCRKTPVFLRYRCIERARISAPGSPRVFATGHRTLVYAGTRRQWATGFEGVFFKIRSKMRVTVKWRRCPKKLKKGRGACRVNLRWDGYGDLDRVFKRRIRT